MSVTLSQSSLAAFPDRGGSGAGLLVNMGQGGDGAALRQDLGAVRPVLYVRVMLGLGTAAGGTAEFLRGLDAAGNRVWSVDLLADARTIALRLAAGSSLSAVLPAALGWHCVEVGIDTQTGTATLWINGAALDSLSDDLSALAAQTLWLGGFFKDAAVTGTFYLDEWTMGDQYQGPVVVAPASAYMNDPGRWLVLYNRDDADSCAWAEYYRQARGIPFANLCGLSLSTQEIISDTEFAAWRTAIGEYLSQNHLTSQVHGLLLGYHVPGYMDQEGIVDATTALLHHTDGSLAPIFNPFYNGEPPAARVEASALTLFRLTARMDGASLADALALVDRATALRGAGVLPAGDMTLWLDPWTHPTSSLPDDRQAVADWAAGLAAQSLRVPIRLTATSLPDHDVDFSAIDHDGFYWTWTDGAAPGVDFFTAPAGQRVLAMLMGLSAASIPTLRGSASWVTPTFQAGYAALAGSARPYSPGNLPQIKLFFAALQQGWTLAEAWILACPFVNEGTFLVGDPLLTVAFPRAGWDVYGPLSNLEELGTAEPLALLGESVTNMVIPPAARATAMDRCWYGLRHVDERGQSDGAGMAWHAVDVQGQAATVPSVPAWPVEEAWPVGAQAGQLVFALGWEQFPSSSVGAALTVQLQGQAQGGTVEVVATPAWSPGQAWVQVILSWPAVATCYRWVVTTSSGATWTSPWSQMVAPITSPTSSLTLLEVTP